MASMLLDEFFNYLDCVEEDAMWQLFNMKNLVGEVTGDTHIQIQDEYAEFIKILSKLEVKRRVFLKLANVVEEEKEDEVF